ncbi:unnamed protein product [Cuscuta europaea]|uniref:Uncharacterized protein n=1 Tax=Cuscuta europaea TaxID=41803 RepID=A0A9P1EMJ5_CUSEU|nr:unnamed protein product [Cuscuta europaea]
MLGAGLWTPPTTLRITPGATFMGRTKTLLPLQMDADDRSICLSITDGYLFRWISFLSFLSLICYSVNGYLFRPPLLVSVLDCSWVLQAEDKRTWRPPPTSSVAPPAVQPPAIQSRLAAFQRLRLINSRISVESFEEATRHIQHSIYNSAQGGVLKENLCCVLSFR